MYANNICEKVRLLSLLIVLSIIILFDYFSS